MCSKSWLAVYVPVALLSLCFPWSPGHQDLPSQTGRCPGGEAPPPAMTSRWSLSSSAPPAPAVCGVHRSLEIGPTTPRTPAYLAQNL